MSCCPPGSLPALTVDYAPRGEFVTKEGAKFYVTGSGDSGKAVVGVYDVFGGSMPCCPLRPLDPRFAACRLHWFCTGFNSGRIRAVADHIADAGFLVIIPDIFDGDDVEAHGGFSSATVTWPSWCSRVITTSREGVYDVWCRAWRF
jgi:dienelactone hydrolase